MSLNKKQISFIYENAEGERLDKVLCSYFEKGNEEESWTRSQIKQWIENGSVYVNGEPQSKAGFLLKPGARIEFEIAVSESSLRPYEVPLDIIFEDEALLVINKGPGLSMHPGAGNHYKTLANAIVAHLSSQGTKPLEGQRPGIVHRLDKDTTGLVVVAKTIQAHAFLAKQFATREASRRYLALVLSTPRAKRLVDRSESGSMEGNIGRHPSQRKIFSVLESGGKAAITHWKVIERMLYASLLEVKIATGRTHQIRVHMAHYGSPVIGDPVYGDFSALPTRLKQIARVFGRQCLHAAYLEFKHPKTLEFVNFHAEAPDDFKALLDKFRKLS
ncbi:MAG: RluA family pseudouridine synthase [SAR324 cluster bacterium]|uniref:Pseudouridine synthase n=1 Tax=SAR324 cluster bacterium TaxID=2024889 RepID=A0A7X9FTQ3_9DELT|nr:RluA family pseudouridine synthase [SAR324 cluster bacterium]